MKEAESRHGKAGDKNRQRITKANKNRRRQTKQLKTDKDSKRQSRKAKQERMKEAEETVSDFVVFPLSVADWLLTTDWLIKIWQSHLLLFSICTGFWLKSACLSIFGWTVLDYQIARYTCVKVNLFSTSGRAKKRAKTDSWQMYRAAQKICIDSRAFPLCANFHWILIPMCCSFPGHLCWNSNDIIMYQSCMEFLCFCELESQLLERKSKC